MVIPCLIWINAARNRRGQPNPMTHESQLAALGLFDASVPRYTSYPTAPQFGTGIGAGDYADWLTRIPAGSEISMYLHVPFCRRLCWFCACRTQGTSTLDPVAAYVQTLLAELAMLRTRLAPGIRLLRLHWGGGTPTLLSPAMMTELARAIFAAFPLAPGGEFSVEIDPNEIDDARLDALCAAGMNRASIGVQDFDPDIQAAIGRAQSFDLTRDVVRAIRARGVPGLNADILYGLPHQTPARITTSVQKLLSLSPDRVALYGYAHVPWMSRRQQMIPAEALPSPAARLDLFNIAARLFAADGYHAIGIDHFALQTDGLARAQAKGALRRNFQGYTDDTAPVLIGLGASAISRLPQGFAQNASATAAHTQAIRARAFSTHRGHALTPEDRLRARMIEMIMCDFAVDTAALARDFPGSAPLVADLCQRIAARFGHMVTHNGAWLFVLPDGRPLTRMIARVCDGYVATAARYSAAI
jgi:oxygen-independent coproporphyrinogen III oxidase